MTQKKKRRIPPPNPPYRTRKKGRYSMLRGLFKNTADTPVVLDESEGPPLSQPNEVKDTPVANETEKGSDEGCTTVCTTDSFQMMMMLNSNEEAMHDDDYSTDSLYNSDEERMVVSSCDEEDCKFPEFNEVTDMKDPNFVLGMLFTSGQVFREAVRRYAIVQQRAITLKKNHTDKIKWVCAEGCDWKCYGLKMKKTDTFQIKTLQAVHTCNPTWIQKQVNSTLIAQLYEDELRMNPTWPTEAFHSKVVNDLKCNISLSMIYRALKKAKDNIIGKHEAEFGKLFAYGNEIKKQMPASTVKIMSEPAGNGTDAQRFKRFYVCLGPLKEGFLDGCRPIIGLDGCHLKGLLGGILLTAVGCDPNDGMYPIAWAQVEAENTDSWNWFIGLLKNDLNINNSGTYTFISDKQKGLVNALESQVPEAEHRFCVQHLYNNMKIVHKGLGIQRLLWCAAKATTDYYFKKTMDNLKKVAPRAHQWLAEKPRAQWSRSGFRELCKSDMFVNNHCEIFNNAINKYRDMGIVTMFKSIHTSCMQRIQRRKSKMERKNTTYCTRPLKKLDKSMSLASKARPVWNGADKFHVTMTEGGHEIVCDLKNHTCACRKWQLTGIPCFHAVACIFFQKKNPLDYLHECHKREWYLRVYSHVLEPISGEEFWEEPEVTPILPPKVKVAPGRPKKKRDKKNDDVQARDSDSTRLKRISTKGKCKRCGQEGHNIRTCNSKVGDQPQRCQEEGVEPSKAAETNPTVQDHTSGASTVNRVQLASPATMEQLTAKTTTHAGVLKAFKAPSQKVLGVESVKGQKFTTLTNLHAARDKKQKKMGKQDK